MITFGLFPSVIYTPHPWSTSTAHTETPTLLTPAQSHWIVLFESQFWGETDTLITRQSPNLLDLRNFFPAEDRQKGEEKQNQGPTCAFRHFEGALMLLKFLYSILSMET